MGRHAGLATVTDPTTTVPRMPAGPGGPGGGPALDIGALARRSSVSVLGSVFAAAANIALVVAVTRGVDQRTAGLFFTATSLFMLLEITCRLGTTTGLVYFIPRYRVTGETGKVGPLLRAALVPVVLVSLVVAAVLVALAPALARGLGDDGSGGLATALRVLAVFLPIAAVYDAITAATRAYQDMTPTVLVERIGRPFGQLVLVAGALLVGSAALLVPGWVAAVPDRPGLRDLVAAAAAPG